MEDYSFIRLKDNFNDAKSIGDSRVVTHPYFDCISLSPNEAYLQITNVDGGVSFDGQYIVSLVNCNDEVLKDITNNVFIEEFTDVNGNNQIKFEIVNINEDFYRQTLYLKFTSIDSNIEYWSNPLNVTDYEIEQTTYFEYENYYDFEGICYSVANCSQSIRLKTYFDIPIDESEVQDYFQVTRNRTISARVLIKRFEQYKIDGINRFTFERLNLLLKHDLIYVDGVRMTNKTTLESSERFGLSNLFESSFVISKDYNDKKDYEYQIFDGLQLLNLYPQGNYTLSGINGNSIQLIFNTDVSVLNGNITIYDASDNSVVAIITQDDLEYIGGGEVESLNTLDTIITENGTYYFNIDSGLFISEAFGLPFDGISDSTTWTFTVGDADFLGTDFNNDDFFTD